MESARSRTPGMPALQISELAARKEKRITMLHLLILWLAVLGGVALLTLGVIAVAYAWVFYRQERSSVGSAEWKRAVD